MNWIRCILAWLFIIAVSVPSAWAVNYRQDVTLKAKTVNALGTPVPAAGYAVASFQVCCGAFTGTISFMASLDGTNFEPLGCIPITDNPYLATPVTTATAKGIWRCDTESINTSLRADLSGYGAGTITVTIMQSTR